MTIPKAVPRRRERLAGGPLDGQEMLVHENITWITRAHMTAAGPVWVRYERDGAVFRYAGEEPA